MSTRANDVAHMIKDHLEQRPGWPHVVAMTHEPNPDSPTPNWDGTFRIYLAAEFTGLILTIQDIPLEEVFAADCEAEPIDAIRPPR